MSGRVVECASASCRHSNLRVKSLLHDARVEVPCDLYCMCTIPDTLYMYSHSSHLI